MSLPALFPDTSVAVNFAAVNRMDILITWLSGRGAFCDAVHRELLDWESALPPIVPLIKTLGDPIELNRAEEERAERVRVSAFGGTSADPRQHLGEAYTLTLLTERAKYQGAAWISDDSSSRELAQYRGIQTYSTAEVLIDLVGHWEIPAAEALKIWQEIYDHPRGGCEELLELAELRRRAGV